MENRELFEQLFRAFNERDWAFYEEHIADDVIVHDSETNTEYRGFNAYRELTEEFFADYPDARIDINTITGSDNHLAALVHISGTRAEANSEEAVDIEGMVHCRIEDGEFVEIWTLTD